MLKKYTYLSIIILHISLVGMEQPLPDLNNPLILLECHLSEDIIKILERKFTRVKHSVDYSEIDLAFEDATALMHNSSIGQYKDGEFLHNVKNMREELFKKLIPKFPTLVAAINEQQGLADDFYPQKESEDTSQKEAVQENAIQNAFHARLEQERIVLEARLLALEQGRNADNERKEQRIASLEQEVANQRWLLKAFKFGAATAAAVALYAVHRNANVVTPSTPDNSKQVGFLEGSFKSLSNTYESLRSAFTTNSEKTDKRIKSLEDAAKAQAEMNTHQAEINDSLQKQLKAVEERPTIEIEDKVKPGSFHAHQIFIIDKDGKKELVNGAMVFRTPPVQPKKRRK